MALNFSKSRVSPWRAFREFANPANGQRVEKQPEAHACFRSSFRASFFRFFPGPATIICGVPEMSSESRVKARFAIPPNYIRDVASGCVRRNSRKAKNFAKIEGKRDFGRTPMRVSNCRLPSTACRKVARARPGKEFVACFLLYLFIFFFIHELRR